MYLPTPTLRLSAAEHVRTLGSYSKRSDIQFGRNGVQDEREGRTVQVCGRTGML